jgi:hypothetical protein
MWYACSLTVHAAGIPMEDQLRLNYNSSFITSEADDSRLPLEELCTEGCAYADCGPEAESPASASGSGICSNPAYAGTGMATATTHITTAQDLIVVP